MACASQPNSIGTGPAYGNVNVGNDLFTLPSLYYPANSFTYNNIRGGLTVYSDGSVNMTMYCYSTSGIATGMLGTGFTGFVWMNYTVPSYGTLTQQVATVYLKYT